MERLWTLTLATKEADGKVEVSDISEYASHLYLIGSTIEPVELDENAQSELCTLELSGTFPWAPEATEKEVIESISRALRHILIEKLATLRK